MPVCPAPRETPSEDGMPIGHGPSHAGEVIGLGLVAKILRDCDMSREEFQAFL